MNGADTANVPLTTADILWAERVALRGGRASSDLGKYEDSAPGERLSALCPVGRRHSKRGIRPGSRPGPGPQRPADQLRLCFERVGRGLSQQLPSAVDRRRHQPAVREEQVAAALKASLAGPEAPEITRLREGANFITPRVGSMSVDTWTAVATSIRNLLVNWTLFLPLFLLITSIPQIVYWFLFPLPDWGAPLGLLLQFVGLTAAMTTVGRSLPSYRSGDEPAARLIRLGIVPPVLLASAGAMMVLSAPPWRGWTEEERLLPCAIVFVASTAAAALITTAWSIFNDKIPDGSAAQGRVALADLQRRRRPRRHVPGGEAAGASGDAHRGRRRRDT